MHKIEPMHNIVHNIGPINNIVHNIMYCLNLIQNRYFKGKCILIYFAYIPSNIGPIHNIVHNIGSIMFVLAISWQMLAWNISNMLGCLHFVSVALILAKNVPLFHCRYFHCAYTITAVLGGGGRCKKIRNSGISLHILRI